MSYDRFKAAYLKKIRKEKGLKLEAVASLTHFSTSYLSEIERSKKIINQEEWINLFSKLEVKLQTDDDINSIIDFFTEFYKSIAYLLNDDILCYSQKFVKNKQIYENSIIFLNYHIVSLIYNISSFQLDEAKYDVDILEKYLDYLNEEEYYIYKVYFSAYLMQGDKIYDAIELLEELNVSHIKLIHISTMMHYYLAHCYFAISNHLKSYYHIKLCQENCLKENNINRYLVALQQEANLFSEQKNYSHANKIYDQLLKLITDKKTHSYLVTCVNYAYCLCKQSKYEEALNTLALMNDNYKYFPQLILNKIYCLFFLDKEQCLQYIDEIDLTEISIRYVLEYIQIFRLLIVDNNSKELEKKAQTLLTKYSDELDSNAKELILNQLLEYYKRTGNLRKQLITMEALLSLK